MVRAVERFTNAVEMDKWPIDDSFTFEDLVDTCYDRVDEASHFLGLFAYRYGWQPDCIRPPRSITEAEFDRADELGKRIAVFLPNRFEPIADELKKLAKGQSEQDRIRQENFLSRVRNKPFMEFKDPLDLALRTSDVMHLWKGGGLRRIADAESDGSQKTKALNESIGASPAKRTAASVARATARMPDEHEFSRLGRAIHYQVFQQSLNVLATPGTPKQMCFVIQGPVGFGHQEFVWRLREEFESTNNPQPRTITIPIGVAWRGSSVNSLLDVLGRELGLQQTKVSIACLAEQLSSVLAAVDVLIEIHYSHRFDESTDGLLASFWQPLLNSLQPDVRKRLMLIVTEEKRRGIDAMTQVQPPLSTPDDLHCFDPCKAIQLPELGNFMEGEISRWLCQFKEIEEAELVARTMFEETEGNPSLLRQRIYDDELWN